MGVYAPYINRFLAGNQEAYRPELEPIWPPDGAFVPRREEPLRLWARTKEWSKWHEYRWQLTREDKVVLSGDWAQSRTMDKSFSATLILNDTPLPRGRYQWWVEVRFPDIRQGHEGEWFEGHGAGGSFEVLDLSHPIDWLRWQWYVHVKGAPSVAVPPIEVHESPPPPLPTPQGVPASPSLLTEEPAPAAEEPEERPAIKPIGEVGGLPNSITIQGQYAYIGQSAHLTVLDVSNPSSPEVVGKSGPLPSAPNDIAIAGRYAYVATGDFQADLGGLSIVDISDPAGPALLSSLGIPDDIAGIALQGGYAFLIGHSGLYIVDVSDPTNPRQVGYSSSSGLDIAVAGNYAFVSAYDALVIVDVSDPTSPFRAASYSPESVADSLETAATLGGLAVLGDNVFVATVSGLRVVSVSQPSTPYEVGACEFDSPTVAYNVAIRGRYALVTGAAVLRVVDISDPTQPREVARSETTPGMPMAERDVAASDGYAFVLDFAGLTVVDISTPTSPRQVGAWRSSMACDVEVSGSQAYMAGCEGAYMSIADISDPTRPHEMGHGQTGVPFPEYIALSGDHAFVSGFGGGLSILDVADPRNPWEISYYDQPSADGGLLTASISMVDIARGHVYFPSYDSYFYALDISDPAYPREAWHLRSPLDFCSGAVTVAEELAYVATNGAGLWVVDISDPEEPRDIAAFIDSGGGEPYDMAIAGSYAYIATTEGLRIADVSDPSHPHRVGGYDMAGGASGVAADGRYVYLAAGNAGLRVLDASDPAHTQEVCVYDTPGDATRVAVDGGYIYVADGANGLLVLQLME